RPLDVAPGEACEDLHAVAQAEHRGTHREQGGIRGGDPLVVDRAGPAREDDASRAPLADPLDGSGGRMNLTVDVSLAHSSGNELRVLRAKIDDQDAIVVLRSAQGSILSLWKSSWICSRALATHQRSPSTSTSAGRGRVL